MIEVSSIVKLLVIMTGLKMVVEKWEPPFQKSVQALILLALGAFTGCFLTPSKEGFITGLIAGTISFWGSGIFAEIKELKEGIQNIKNEERK